VLLFLLVQKPGDEWLLYLATGLQLALSGIYFPARTAILPDICAPNEVGTANAISATTWSVMLAFGAALGGVATGIFGVYPSFVLDSMSFVLSAFLQSLIHYDFVQAADEVKISIQSTFQQYIEGLRFLRHQADLFVIAMQKGLMALVIIGAFQVIMVTLSKEYFVIGKDGTTGLGIMYGMVGLGTGVSPIVMRRFTGDRNRPMRLMIILGYLIASVAMFVLMPLASFEMILVGMFLRGFGLAIIWVFTTQLLLQLTPARVRGRVFATEFAIQSLGAAAGSFIGGLAADVLDMQTVIMWMGFIILIPGVMWVLWIWLGKTAEAQVADNSMLIPRTPTEKVNQPTSAAK
jgi:MFS family permease